MSALTPGLYKATVRGVQCRTVFVDDGGYGSSLHPVLNHHSHEPHQITDARPLIVLDITPHAVMRALEALREGGGMVAMNVADQIEAQTKPARIEEPDYAGARVMARLGPHEPNEFLRIVALTKFQWASLRTGSIYTWDALTDPTFIRDGIES